jgi:hypothetical protein
MIIESVLKQEMAYSKSMVINYEGKEYQVLLYWSNWEGYELDFIGLDEPEWAINWEDNNDESLAYTLDTLTDQTIEESYL